ncbi:MAG: hypothetical protein ACTH0D_12770 [Candidatus Corynebacterium faecigallinarum]|nr:hypothetical protein [Corynebacterium sp.]
MDLSIITDFLATGFGRIVLQGLQFIYELLYPSNTPGVPGP